MIDEKQVVYDIERCICHVPDACRDCSKYKKDQPSITCMEDLLTDALSLLKEHKAEFVEIIDNDGGKTHWYVCGGCKSPINPGDKYCHECGRAVKWQ